MKRDCFLILILLLIFIIGCNGVTIQQIQADRIIRAESFDQLIDVSDLIIRAEVLQGKETVLRTTEDGLVHFGYTVTQLQVRDVFQGNVNIDDIVVITEEYYLDGKIIWTQGNYLPAREGKSYIFFLKKYSDLTKEYSGKYYPIDLERGKYSLDSEILDNIESIDRLTNKQLEIWENPDKEYRDWYQKVMRQFYPNH